MTKKDYELIAVTVKVFDGDMSGYCGANESKTRRVIVTDIAQRLADALAAENPLFNRQKFLEACGVKND